MARTVTGFRADCGRPVRRQLPRLAVERKLQHLVGAERRGIDELVAAVGHDRNALRPVGMTLIRSH